MSKKKHICVKKSAPLPDGSIPTAMAETLTTTIDPFATVAHPLTAEAILTNEYTYPEVSCTGKIY